MELTSWDVKSDNVVVGDLIKELDNSAKAVTVGGDENPFARLKKVEMCVYE